jgi:hypothetical protein
MKIKHISRISLSSGRTPEKQGHLTISLSVLGKVVIDAERVSF